MAACILIDAMANQEYNSMCFSHPLGWNFDPSRRGSFFAQKKPPAVSPGVFDR